jgi:hypothetical protein
MQRPPRGRVVCRPEQLAKLSARRSRSDCHGHHVLNPLFARAYLHVRAFAFVLATSLAKSVHAAPPAAVPTVALEVARDAKSEECASSGVLQARIAERMGRSPFSSVSHGAMRILRISFRRDRKWTAELSFQDPQGSWQSAATPATAALRIFTFSYRIEPSSRLQISRPTQSCFEKPKFNEAKPSCSYLRFQSATIG